MDLLLALPTYQRFALLYCLLHLLTCQLISASCLGPYLLFTHVQLTSPRLQFASLLNQVYCYIFLQLHPTVIGTRRAKYAPSSQQCSTFIRKNTYHEANIITCLSDAVVLFNIDYFADSRIAN